METPENPLTDQETRNWLTRLQQDSWQLELIVSGFVIFLLIGGWEPLNGLSHKLAIFSQNQEIFFLSELFLSLVTVAYLALLLLLLVHLVLRGLWIAAIGLRSVSGEIDYERFRYAPRFIDRIKKSTGSFDDYVIRLERWCSVFFSLAFLIVFCFMSILSWSVAVFALQFLAAYLLGFEVLTNNPASNNVSNLMSVLGVIYLFDFISLGLLKRVRSVNRVYYPLYRFLGWLSLARLYRPLYYNLIDNGFGRRLVVATPFVVLIIMLGAAAKLVRYPYMPNQLGEGQEWVLGHFYDDEGVEPERRLWLPALKSRYVQHDYVEVFVPYVPINHDEKLLLIDSTLEVGRYAGLAFGKPFGFSSVENYDADYAALLRAFTDLRRVYVNDSLVNVLPRFANHNTRGQSGVVYMIPAHDLPVGEHTLRIDTRMHRTDTVDYSRGVQIYFYK